MNPLDLFSHISDISSILQEDHKGTMSLQDMSVPDSPIDSGGMSPRHPAVDKQFATLQTYLNSLPYQCESYDEMLAQLEHIAGKIAICAKSRNWLTLTTWDGVLQCWLLMRYPIPKPTRAKLARLYYELCLLPGIEPRVIRSWSDMLSRLLTSKPDQRPKLEPSELELPWKPLWRALQKELWPKRRLQNPSRNVVNVLLFVAAVSKRYYPASDTPDMLSTFIPMITQDTILTMVPVMASFLPFTGTELYLPTVFNLWKSFNSSIVNDWFLELCGDLAEEHITGQAGSAEWRDVGIWSEEQWTLLVGRTLGAMNVPVGSVRGASTTASAADQNADKQALRIKHSFNKSNSLAKIIVYSMCLDSPIRGESGSSDNSGVSTPQNGFIGGSRALDSLDKLITSTESYFHPSNHGHWTLSLTSFIHRLSAEFCKRWKEEQQPSCKIPVTRRLTPSIRRAFVTTLRTPVLLAMFSKDPFSSTFAQGALRAMALLEPGLVMPDLLERAYSGLEVVNETHRTTAVLSALAGAALPLVSEKVWLGGQKHIVPLLELCIPGIDLNDPMKTLCASLFIVSVVQHMKIGDLSIQQGGVPLSDAQAEEMMDINGHDHSQIPSGTDVGETVILSREEERTLARDSTAGFADWVVSLFRRILALYENLPEEGGKKNTTGGKMEEAVLKSLKGTLDILCLHLSDPLFDLVLQLVYDYGTTNAKSNAVRAFGQLVACLARVKPEQVIAKFLPYCISQIKEELKHGASSVRTTSTHTAIPSDTTLHWNMAILRGCLGYGGAALLKYREQFIELVSLLVDKTKSERGYTGTGRLISRILHTVASVYPINTRFMNTDKWDDPEFNRSHNIYWGSLYEAEDVKIEWHVPCPEEIDFVLEILDKIASPALDKVESLLTSAGKWDNVDRNDFCRYLHPVRSVWSGLPTIYREGPQDVKNPCFYEESEVEALLVTPLALKAGFVLEDPSDPRYQKVVAHRLRFGNVIHRASVALQQNLAGEDHIDAVISVSKAIDVYLLEYAMTRSAFDGLQKAYTMTRDLNRMSPRQKENTRQVFLKRAQAYHSGRVYLHSLYRRRSELDDMLLGDLVELSLSPYTRVRRHAQAVFNNACGYFLRSTRFCLPMLLGALAKGTEPDRMKGALYILWNKGITSYALADAKFRGQFLDALLECQHQEKPSIQKLIGNVAHDALTFLTEESLHTDAFTEDAGGVDYAIDALSHEFTQTFLVDETLGEALRKARVRASVKAHGYEDSASSILEIASRPTTHWRYIQMASQMLLNLIRRDSPPSPALARFFVTLSTSPHRTTRSTAHQAIVKITSHIKIRTYAKSTEEIWLDEWHSPLKIDLPIQDPSGFAEGIRKPFTDPDAVPFYVDKLNTGFLAWTPVVKAYQQVGHGPSAITWEAASQPALQAMREVVLDGKFFGQLIDLLGEESNKNPSTLKLRPENVNLMKSLTKMFEHEILEDIFPALEPVLTDSDRYRQRAGAEILVGLIRGSKHWPRQHAEILWTWALPLLQSVYAHLKPDTLGFWEDAFNELLSERDSRRSLPIIDWLLALPLDFQGDSAFAMSKTLILFNLIVDCCWPYFEPMSDQYMAVFLANANTGYAEIRSHIAHNLVAIVNEQWRPSYSSLEAYYVACAESKDPLRVRNAKHFELVSQIAAQLPIWRQERLPPPRVSQSQYDKVGLTMLQWIWTASHGAYPALMFPYILILLPEILRMSELNDSSELQKYSAAVLYVLSALTPPPSYVEVVADGFLAAIQSSDSWRVRLKALPTLLVFFYRNLMNIPNGVVSRMMDVLLECLSDENVEVREMASKMLSGVVRCSQRQSIIPLRDRFVKLARSTKLPPRRDPAYPQALRTLHSAILGICALIESFPYSVEAWLPPLTDVLAEHATDPIPISTTIRKCASEFKKTHQDTWHKDQLAFDEDQLQSLSTMLVGTSYYA